MITTYSPNQFLTKTEPTVNNLRGKLQYDFDALLARRGCEFQFVDYLFTSKTSDLCGAVGTTMRPVSPEEVERTEKQYRDRDTSPIAYLYEEQSPQGSWSGWIESWFKHEGYGTMFDLSYQNKYGPIVIEEIESNSRLEFGDVELVECIAGGRMFNRIDRNDYDEVYDHELFRLVQEAENNGLGALY